MTERTGPMPPRAPQRRATIRLARGFREAFEARNEGQAREPDPAGGAPTTALERALATFLEHKEERPPRRLPSRFRDHMLGGNLDRYRECHLAGDVLVIYRDAGGVVSVLALVDHDELRGGRGRALARRLRDLVDEG